LATIDLVGWDVHRAIVENVFDNTSDEAHETLRLPEYMAKLCDAGVLGDKTGGGFFKSEDKVRFVLDPATGDYTPEAEVPLPALPYIHEVSAAYAEGRYADGMRAFLEADGDEAAIARRVVAGYISYAFHRVGEVTETLNGIDRIMGTGFNWAPPGVLVDLMGTVAAVDLIDKAGLPVPSALVQAARTGEPKRFFSHPQINTGKFFVAG
jgi:3-hydroxyacyl-CoA dehydrogenase